MKTMTVAEIAAMAGGEPAGGAPSTNVVAVSTDTRTISPGSLFVALAGERYNGHDFIPAAVEAGAAAVMVHDRERGIASEASALIVVDDTLRGLQRLAAAYRNALGLKAVVITGSNGKTSTKDFVHVVLKTRFRVTATVGNLNNHIGLPLSILRSSPQDEWGVWEIGMNHPGEIAPLAALAAPDLGVITNIGTAHLGNMGSVDAIAREKGMLAEALPANGALFMNAGDAFASSIGKRTAAKMVLVGFDDGEIRAAAVQAESGGTRFRLEADGDFAAVRLAVPGRHMVLNALLAAGVGREAGVPLDEIAGALSRAPITPGRLQPRVARGVRFIDDSYNANPDSMRVSLSTAAEMEATGRRLVLLGAMAELGTETEDAHRTIGALASRLGFDHIASVGEDARGYTADLPSKSGQLIHHFRDHQEAAAFLRERAEPGDLVLLKGSRTAAMEKIYNLYAGDHR